MLSDICEILWQRLGVMVIAVSGDCPFKSMWEDDKLIVSFFNDLNSLSATIVILNVRDAVAQISLHDWKVSGSTMLFQNAGYINDAKAQRCKPTVRGTLLQVVKGLGQKTHVFIDL
ncbi:hypothetical protein AAE478_009474 [Parahypoxylon ruwenzoriense]